MEPIISFDRPLYVDEALVGEVTGLVNILVDEEDHFTSKKVEKVLRFYLPESRRERDMIFMRSGKDLLAFCALVYKSGFTFQEAEIREFYCPRPDEDGSFSDLFLEHVVKAARGKCKKEELRGILTYFPREQRECRPHLFAELHGFAVKSFRANQSHTLEFVNHFEKVVAP